jgi:hypothetical protein
LAHFGSEDVRKYLFLYRGVTPETCEAISDWHWSLGMRVYDDGCPVGVGRDVTPHGLKPAEPDSEEFTGFAIMMAEDLGQATAIAQSCPPAITVRIYEQIPMCQHSN